MRPYLEKLPAIEGASWSLLNRRLDEAIPFQWHHHPEFELTLTLNSRGQRFIGDHIGSYDDGDLVLVGPNLPHSWSSAAKVDATAPHVALVMWFHPEWAKSLDGAFVEMRSVTGMLRRAGAGLAFSPAFSAKARPWIERLFEEAQEARLLGLLRVLQLLAMDENARPLASAAFGAKEETGDRGRIDRVLDHIHFNYAAGLSIGELAGIAALSPSGLHRLFRRHTRMNVSDYVMRLRIGEACAMLSGGGKPIGHIADAVGYGSLANFNRQFKALKGMTPRDYRRRFEVSSRRR